MSETRKKIIIIGPAYPYRGGNSLFVSHVYDILSSRFKVKIFNYKLLYPAFLFPGTTQYDNSASTIKKAPNERIVNSISPFNWIKTASLLVKENADMIVFDWWHPFFSFCHFTISFLIKKKYKGRILFITENVISHESHFIDKMLTKLGLKNASMFLALSDKVEKDLGWISKNKKIYKSELPVYDCYNTADTILSGSAKKELGFEAEDKILLFFGYVRKYKGLDVLLNAMPGLIEYDKSLRLLVVGEFYEEEKSYFEAINSKGLDKFVKIINKFIPNEEVNRYFAPADLVVLPYRSATQSGILNVAYGFSKPVLVTDVGGLAEFVEQDKTGFIIKPDSTVEIVNGVKKFYKFKDKINFEENIHSLVNKNSFNNLPELFDRIIKESEE